MGNKKILCFLNYSINKANLDSDSTILGRYKHYISLRAPVFNIKRPDDESLF